VTVLARGDSVAPVAFPDMTLAVEELLGQLIQEHAPATPEP
jgi:hypothetical protein